MFLVEPKIKAPFAGTLHVENMHEDVVISIKNSKQEQKYIIRKHDLAKPNELTGVSGNLVGKLYMHYSNRAKVEQDESIVEVIKEGWNVPNRIPYASEILVEDGDPVVQTIKAGEKGILKFYMLKGDGLDRLRNIKKGYVVKEKGLFVVIADKNDREAKRHYIPRESVIEFDDSSTIDDVNAVIARARDAGRRRSRCSRWRFCSRAGRLQRRCRRLL